MSNVETGIQGRLEIREFEGTINIERVFPYFIPASNYIVRELEAGREPALLKVVMGVKSDESEPSPTYLTPISGSRKEREPHLDAAHRILREKTTLAASPVQGYEDDFVFRSPYRRRDGFSYRINHPKYPQRRNVSATAVPVLSTVIFEHSERGKGKFKRVLNFPISELRSVFISGFYERVEDGQLVHYPLIESSQIEENNDAKDSQLSSLLNFLTEKEESVRHMVIEYLGGHRKDSSESLLQIYRRLLANKIQELTIPEEDAAKVLERAKKEVEVLISEVVDIVRADIDSLSFMREEQKLIPTTPKETSSPKILKKLRVDAERLRILINKGNKGKDVLHLMPLIAKLGPHVAGSTEAASTFMRFINELFEYAPQRFRGDPNVLNKLLANLDQAADHSEIADDLDKTQKEMFKIIDELFGCEPGFARRIWRESLRNIPQMAENTREIDPSTYSKYFQIHERRRNIRNLPYVIHEALRGKTEDRRFEALRQLLVYFKGLFVRKRGEEILDAGDERFRLAIDSFFQDTNIERGFKGRSLRITKAGNYTVVIDEKTEKNEASQVRKSLLEDPDDIRDIFSQSIILIGDGQGKVLFEEDAIAAIKAIAKGFIMHLKRKNPRHEVRVVDNRSTFDFYRDFYDNKISKEDLSEVGGKRVGSKADLIVRRKFVIVMKNPQNPEEEYVHEFTFYPFISIGPFTVGHKIFMGWAEKLDDDKPYMVRRMIEPLPGMHRSMYDLFFPSVFYQHAPDIQEKLREQMLADLI